MTNDQLRKCGFTLVELVFVTLLLTILLVSAAPNFRGAWRGLEMEGAAVDLAQMLRSARVLAITRGEPVVWHWEASAQRAQLSALQEQEPGQVEAAASGGAEAASGGGAEAAPIPGRLGRAHHLPGEVEITIVREDEPVNDIQFFPDGTSEAAFVVVGEPGNPQYQIEVDGPTSQVFLRKGAPRVPAR